MTPTIANARNFLDVQDYYKHKTAIDHLADSGVVKGYDDGSFRPDNTINRAEFVKIIIESRFDLNEINSCVSASAKPHWTYMFFPDVSLSQWFAKYICTAKTNNVIGGYPDSTFRPSNTINFAEGLKVILDSYGVELGRIRVIENKLLHINKNDWFAPYFSYAHNKNLINREKFYHPAQNMTRGEMAEIIYRLETIKKNGGGEFKETKTHHSNEYKITIPRLNIVDLNVSFADPYNAKNAMDVLKNGLGHYLSPPGGGKRLVIFGHSSGYGWDNSAYKTILRQIDKIQTGDYIYINYHEKGYVYRVYKEEILPAEQLTFIMKDPGAEDLALYTCWPPDSIQKRYVVYAERS